LTGPLQSVHGGGEEEENEYKEEEDGEEKNEEEEQQLQENKVPRCGGAVRLARKRCAPS